MHVVRRVRQGGGTEGGQNGAGGGATAEVLAEQHDGQENRERGLEVQEERADDGRNTRETEQHEYRGGDSARGDDEEEKQEVDAAESRLALRRVRSLPSRDQCRRGEPETGTEVQQRGEQERARRREQELGDWSAQAEQNGGRESGRDAGRHGRRRPAHLADGRLLRPDPRADLPQQRGVVGVTGHARGDATTNRAAEQVEVAEDVEDLVAYELVGEA